jgi:hypothetical protein
VLVRFELCHQGVSRGAVSTAASRTAAAVALSSARSVARARGGEGSRAKRRAAHPEREEELGEAGGGETAAYFTPELHGGQRGTVTKALAPGLPGSINCTA